MDSRICERTSTEATKPFLGLDVGQSPWGTSPSRFYGSCAEASVKAARTRLRAAQGILQHSSLVLFAGAGDNPLQGELTEVVLNEPREYVALSYNWDRIEMQPSQRYLQTPIGIFGLPASLHSALHCLRDPFQHRMIWVAAICVPHDNRMEWEELFKALQICVRARPRLVGDRDGSTENCECAIAAYTLGVLREAYRTTPPGIQYSLLQLLDICWYSSSSPLDKLYSLLHLASDGEQAALQPNYTQPLEAVIFRYAASFVDRGDALYLLYRAGTGKSFAF